MSDFLRESGDFLQEVTYISYCYWCDRPVQRRWDKVTL